MTVATTRILWRPCWRIIPSRFLPVQLFERVAEPDDLEAASCMERFAIRQTGKVGDMAAGREPVDYVDYPYIEVYSDQNGRIVLELDHEQVKIIGTPIPACESDPISREAQAANMVDFLTSVACALGAAKREKEVRQ